LSGLPIGKRAKQHGSHHAKRRYVRADAERQGENCDSGEARSLGKHSGGIAEILQE
jgi:hypothetical protein